MLFDLSQFPIEIQQQIVQTTEPISFTQHGQVIKTYYPSKEENFSFDIQRLQQSIESGVVDVPQFNNREEFLAWLHR